MKKIRKYLGIGWILSILVCATYVKAATLDFVTRDEYSQRAGAGIEVWVNDVLVYTVSIGGIPNDWTTFSTTVSDNKKASVIFKMTGSGPNIVIDQFILGGMTVDCGPGDGGASYNGGVESSWYGRSIRYGTSVEYAFLEFITRDDNTPQRSSAGIDVLADNQSVGGVAIGSIPIDWATFTVKISPISLLSDVEFDMTGTGPNVVIDDFTIAGTRTDCGPGDVGSSNGGVESTWYNESIRYGTWIKYKDVIIKRKSQERNNTTRDYFLSSTYVKPAVSSTQAIISWDYTYAPGTYPNTTPPDTYPYADAEYAFYGLDWALRANNVTVAENFATFMRNNMWSTVYGWREQAQYWDGVITDYSVWTNVNLCMAKYLRKIYDKNGNNTYLTWANESYDKGQTAWVAGKGWYDKVYPSSNTFRTGCWGQAIYELWGTSYISTSTVETVSDNIVSYMIDNTYGGAYYATNDTWQVTNSGKDMHDNGWVIAGLAKAYEILGKSTYISKAKSIADAIIANMWDSNQKSFLNRASNADWTGKDTAIPDLYFTSPLIYGFSELYKITGDTTYRDYACAQLRYYEPQWTSGKAYNFSTTNSGRSIGENMWLIQGLESLSAKLRNCGDAIITSGSISSGTPVNLNKNDGTYFKVQSTTSGSNRKTDWYGWAIISDNKTDVKKLTIAYDGNYTISRTQYIYLWNYNTSQWEQIDSATVGTSDVIRTWTTTDSATIQKYISSSTGEIKIRIYASGGSASFQCWADYLSVITE